eukprot:GILI01022926.1.p1 GENE.GILI01022926.1~~GILI01022926.1.p1  ORF type:complete len:275 (+),score=60.31 GILI01022926.1:40-825(+)
MGRVFRNEGVSPSHNPEFTSCESYQAYADYRDMMVLSEELLSSLATSLTGSYKVLIHTSPSGARDPVTVDFTPPYRRISVVPFLEEKLNTKLPPLNDRSCIAPLLSLCQANNVPVSAPHTPSRLLDALIGHFIEPECVQPTFICDHPLVMSPLAKTHRDHPDRSERFELFVAGKELINAYSELNDPSEQRKRFQLQAQDRGAGDREAQPMDEEFCKALEFGMPPTAGWGIGVDRLVMMLAGVPHIKEVILFPLLRPRNSSS